jgi:hypothetical protein
VPPAHERLDARDAAGRDLDLRLIDEEQLVRVERVAQLGLELQTRDGTRPHVLAVDDAAVAAGGARFVQRETGGAQQLVREAAVVGEDRDTDRAGHEEVAMTDQVGRGERGRDVGDRVLHVGVGLQVADRDGELVARETRERHRHRAVALELEEGAESRRDRLQQRIAGAVSDAVVDALEIIDIHANYRKTFTRSRGFAARFLEQLQQILPVRQLRQRIEERELPDAVRRAVPVGHVTQDEQQSPLVVRHDACLEAAFDAVPHAFELDLGALVAHAAIVERVRDRARRVAGHELGYLLLMLEAAREEGVVLGVSEPVDDSILHVDDEQQIGQGVEHRALATFALLELLHETAAADQVLNAMAEQIPVDRLREEVRRADLVGLVDRGHVVAARHHHDGQMRAARARANRLAGVVTVHRRHLDVHEHGIALAGLDGGERGGAVRGFGDRETRSFQRATHEQPRARIVVDDEDVDGFVAGQRHQATLELSSASSSDSATVRCARSFVIEDSMSLRSPLRAEVSICRAMAATFVAPRFAEELFNVCAASAMASASFAFMPLSMSASSCEESSR